jgi:hypothetical protein
LVQIPKKTSGFVVEFEQHKQLDCNNHDGNVNLLSEKVCFVEQSKENIVSNEGACLLLKKSCLDASRVKLKFKSKNESKSQVTNSKVYQLKQSLTNQIEPKINSKLFGPGDKVYVKGNGFKNVN